MTDPCTAPPHGEGAQDLTPYYCKMGYITPVPSELQPGVTQSQMPIPLRS